jgi:threonine aldolase
MRQVGYLAAAGLYALDNNIHRLVDDHKRAKEIESTLKELSFIKTVEPVETNIIIFELNEDVNEITFVQKLIDDNIKIIGMGGGKLRMVTHLDYNDDMHNMLLDVLKSI